MITQEHLKELLHYDPITGIFIWIKRPARSHIVIGSVAGGPLPIGYWVIGIDNKRYLNHRLAFLYMLDYIPEEVDHENHDRTDNRWKNLRAADRKLNQQNQTKIRTNTSGFTGVTWSAAHNKWRAQISVNKKCVYLGQYELIEHAIEARKEANIKYGFHANHGIIVNHRK